jgi:hypothetical protein
MMWDFRSLIRRGGGKWPRDWRSEDRRPIRPPEPGPKAAPPPPPEADERWITPPWQPPEDSTDAWRKSE